MKLISCPWMKLAIVIVSVCQMVHHPKFPIKSQIKNRLELFVFSHVAKGFGLFDDLYFLMYHHQTVVC